MTKFYFRTLLFFLSLAASSADAAQDFPIRVPLRFGVDSSVQFSAGLDRYRNYYLDLVLRFEGDEQRKLARQAVGDATNVCRALKDCGEVSIFHISIKLGENVVFKQRKEAIGRYALGAESFSRNIVTIPLRPGIYTIRIDVLEYGKLLVDSKAEIQLTTNSLEMDLEN